MDFTAFTVNRLPVFIPVFAAAFGFWDMGGGKGFGFLEKKNNFMDKFIYGIDKTNGICYNARRFLCSCSSAGRAQPW